MATFEVPSPFLYMDIAAHRPNNSGNETDFPEGFAGNRLCGKTISGGEGLILRLTNI
jgi:hypothetical protein